MSMESVDVVSTLLSMVRYVLVCISALTANQHTLTSIVDGSLEIL
jgi:hypothetical protein